MGKIKGGIRFFEVITKSNGLSRSLFSLRNFPICQVMAVTLLPRVPLDSPRDGRALNTDDFSCWAYYLNLGDKKAYVFLHLYLMEKE